METYAHLKADASLLPCELNGGISRGTETTSLDACGGAHLFVGFGIALADNKVWDDACADKKTNILWNILGASFADNRACKVTGWARTELLEDGFNLLIALFDSLLSFQVFFRFDDLVGCTHQGRESTH